jgi:hypothetical protein
MYRPCNNTMGIRRTTDAFRLAYNKETRWVRMEAIPTLDTAMQQAVGLREQQCPLCSGSGKVELMCRGRVTGLEIKLPDRCPCQVVKQFWLRFKCVGERFYDANLGRIEPSPKVTTPSERQTEIIALLKENALDSFLLVGPPNGGKTFLMASLFQNAVLGSIREQSAANASIEAVWWVSASVLLNQHVAKEINPDAPEPDVTERKIRNAVKYGGWVPRMYIDEIDKIAWSEYKIRRLGELVNAIYQVKGTVVATTNKGLADLSVKWHDADEAATILRRIGADGGHTVDVW